MKEEEITALAREYAEEMHYGDNYFEDENKRFLTWLSRRFCLVEKETVRKAFWRLTDKLLSDGDAKSFGAASLVLKSLFPRIRKEVEE